MIDKVRGMFDMNGSFFEFAKKLLYVFILNIIFVITCLPVFTVGISVTSMNSVFLKIINDREFHVFKDYFKSFKENFLKATAVWLMALAVILVLYIDIVYWVKFGVDDGIYGYVMLGISCVAAVFLFMYLHTVFPLIARFDMSVREFLSNAFYITVKHILYCMEAAVFTVLIVGVCFYILWTGEMMSMFYLLLLGFGLDGLVQSYIYRRVLNRYSEDYEEMYRKNMEELRQEGFFDEN